MSEKLPDDDKDLETFLSGGSALSRRYRDLAQEEPPAHVDKAILASARWAVGADGGNAGRTRARPRAQRRSFMQWGAPLAMAAVVVLAVALTLTMEREPQLKKIPSPAADQLGRQILEGREVASLDAGKPAEDVAALNVPQPQSSVLPQPAKTETAENEQPLQRLEVEQRPLAALPQAERALPRQEAGFAKAKKQDVATTAGSARVDERKKTVASEPAPVLADAMAPAMPAAPPGPAVGNVATSPAEVAPPATTAEAGIRSEPVRSEASMSSDAADVAGRTAELARDEADRPLSAPETSARTPRSPQQWIADIEVQLKRGNRELARAAVRKFRAEYPDYPLPRNLMELLPESER